MLNNKTVRYDSTDASEIRVHFATILKQRQRSVDKISLTIEINNANTASYNQWDIFTSCLQIGNKYIKDIRDTVVSLQWLLFIKEINTRKYYDLS